MQTIRIMIVDDHPMILEGLQAMLGSVPDFEVIGTAQSGEEAVGRAQAMRPDVMLMDIRMPGTGGLGATAKLTQQRFPGKVILLTVYEDVEFVHTAVRAGASGFLLKQITKQELAAAIRQVHRGETVITPSLMSQFLNSMRGANACSPSDENNQLSVRQIEVLRALVRGRTNKEISADLLLSVHTVNTHVRAIYKKLQVNDRASAVATALRLSLTELHPTAQGLS